MSLTAASMNDMSGLHTIITGAGSGIGLMMAKTYAAHGATVYLVGRRLEKLQEAKKSIEESGVSGSVVTLQGDISTKEGHRKLLGDYTTASGLDRLDILVANAGIIRKEGESWSPELDADAMSSLFLSTEAASWTETSDLNVASQYYLIGLFIPLLAKAKDGNVIVTTSIAGVHWSCTSSNPSYSASKAAMNHIVKLMANRLSQLYIRVNAIAPGIFPSELANEEVLKKLKSAVQKIPAKRVGEERDMGQAAVFLGMCRYCHGQVLVVDGGRSLAANGQ